MLNDLPDEGSWDLLILVREQPFPIFLQLYFLLQIAWAGQSSLDKPVEADYTLRIWLLNWQQTFEIYLAEAQLLPGVQPDGSTQLHHLMICLKRSTKVVYQSLRIALEQTGAGMMMLICK